MAATTLTAARVNTSSLNHARGVLKRNGMTVSLAIQRLMDVIASTDAVPECIAEAPDSGDARAKFDALMSRVASRDEPPWPAEVSDWELLGEERMRRFG